MAASIGPATGPLLSNNECTVGGEANHTGALTADVPPTVSGPGSNASVSLG